MAVHIYGLPIDMDRCCSWRRGTDSRSSRTRRRCTASSIAAVLRLVWRHQHAQLLSEQLVTTGEGGMLLTDDPHWQSAAARSAISRFKPERRFVHDDLGFNYRMRPTSRPRWEWRSGEARRDDPPQTAIGARYRELLAGIPGLELPPDRTDYAESLYWVFGVVLDESIPFDAAAAMKMLQGGASAPAVLLADARAACLSSNGTVPE